MHICASVTIYSNVMLRPRPRRVANRERRGKKEKGSEWEKEEIEERKRGAKGGRRKGKGGILYSCDFSFRKNRALPVMHCTHATVHVISCR